MSRQEAQALLDRGLAADGCCAARAIGYRQALLFLQRCHADVDAATGANLVRACLASGRVLTCNQGAWGCKVPCQNLLLAMCDGQPTFLMAVTQ